MNMENTSQQIKFWALLGPLIVLTMFCIYFLKISLMQMLLPLVAIIGILLSAQWKMKGLVGAIALLALLLVFTFPQVALETRFWYLGMGLATALAFVVTALANEEIEVVVKTLQKESVSHLDYLATVDRTTSLQQGEWAQEKKKLLIELDWTKERIKELESTPKTTSQYEPLYKQLREQFDEKGELLDATRRSLFVSQEELAVAKRELEELRKYEAAETRDEVEKDLLSTNRELEELNENYREEIALLQEMVGQFMGAPR